MVTSTFIGTFHQTIMSSCQYETNLAWVHLIQEKFNRRRLCIAHSLYFYFPQNTSDGSQSERHITTYRYFYAQEGKSPLKILDDQHMVLLNPFICFTFRSSSKKFKFCVELSNGDKTIIGTCHHETKLGCVNSFKNIFLKLKVGKSTRTRQYRVLNIECEYPILSFAPAIFIFLQNTFDGYMSFQRDI